MSVSRSVSLLLILLLFDTIVPDRSAISGDGPDSMVLVPAGEFMMGTPEGSDGLPDEHPARLVYLGAFWIDRYEVTNAAYEKFVRATGYEPPANANPASTLWEHNAPLPGIEQHPVVNVSWLDAIAFCRWAENVSRPKRNGKRPHADPMDVSIHGAMNGISKRPIARVIGRNGRYSSTTA